MADHDALIPPVATITDNGDGTFDVILDTEVHATATSLDQALSDARTMWGEDVEVTGITPSPVTNVTAPAPPAPTPVQAPAPEPVVMPPTEPAPPAV